MRSLRRTGSLAVLAAVTCLAIGAPRRAHAQDAPLAPPPPSAPPPSLTPPPPPAVHAVSVHVEADRAVTLQALASDATRWVPVCSSPCDVEVPLEALYRVVAPGIQASREIELEAAPGDRVVLDVNVRSNAEHQTAQRLTIAGYVAGATGLGLEIGALAVNQSSTAEPVLLWAGVGAAAVAVTLAITSYVMGQPTGLSQSRTAAPPSRAAALSTVRRPSWSLPPGGPALPPPTTAPLLTMTF